MYTNPLGTSLNFRCRFSRSGVCLRFRISNKLPGDVRSAGPQMTLRSKTDNHTALQNIRLVKTGSQMLEMVYQQQMKVNCILMRL